MMYSTDPRDEERARYMLGNPIIQLIGRPSRDYPIDEIDAGLISKVESVDDVIKL